MATSSYYIDLASRHQVYLERLKAGYVKDYEKSIKKLDKAIKDILNGLEVEKLNELTKKEFNKLLKELRVTQLAVYQAYNEDLVSGLQELSDEETQFESEAIKTATIGVAVKEAANGWARAVRNPIQATGELLEPFIKDLSSRQVTRIEKQMRISLSQGRTISQTVRAVRGTKKNNYRDGILRKNWEDARTVIRTSTQHVSTQARVATWEANKDIIDGYQWVSTLDGKTSKVCRSLDQQVFEIGNGPLPPIHPNCRSTTVPYFKDDIELWDKDATRSAETGPVQVSTSYYEWLKRQPAAFQDDAIGPTRGKLLRGGGLSAKEFADLQLDRNFQPLTLEEMRKLKPNAFDKANI